MVSVSGIYVIAHVKSGKIYIGQAQNIKTRWNTHRTLLNHNKHGNRYLQHAWNKYGSKAFQFKILERCAIDQLDEREQHYLDVYMPKDQCYNISPSANNTRGVPCSDETKQKISLARKGQVLSVEARSKMSQSLKGRVFSDDHRRKIGEANRRRPADSEETLRKKSEAGKKGKGIKKPPDFGAKVSAALQGHKLSEETKQKIAEAQRQHQARKRAERDKAE